MVVFMLAQFSNFNQNLCKFLTIAQCQFSCFPTAGTHRAYYLHIPTPVLE